MAIIFFLFCGVALGLWLGKFYWAVKYGRKFAAARGIQHEIELAKRGKKAFEVYRDNSPDLALFALSNHLSELKEEESVFADQHSPTNIKFTLSLVDILRAEALCNGRMAKVNLINGNSNQFRVHAELVLSIASRNRSFATDFLVLTNERSILDYVDRCDEKKRFW